MTWLDPVRRRLDRRASLAALRAALLLLGLVLAVALHAGTGFVAPFVALVAVAAASSLPVAHPRAARLQPVAEIVAAAAVVSVADPMRALEAYLIAPMLAAGLLFGVSTAVTAAGLAVAVLLLRLLAVGLGAPLPVTTGEYVTDITLWAVALLVVGALASWVHHTQDHPRQDEDSYEAAYRLLQQLRQVSRQLSAGLDSVTVAQSLLQGLATRLPFVQAAAYVRSEGGRLVPIAVEGEEHLDGALADDGELDDAVEELDGQPRALVRHHRLDGRPGASTLLPMTVGSRITGLVALDSERPFGDEALEWAASTTQEAALRLETTLLFADVRSIATMEERRRLAREIHDGIAQELASLGYVVDDLTARAEAGAVPRVAGDLPSGDRTDLVDDLRGLRDQLTRLIRELRLSIFDLRSEVQPDTGLGAALSDYVRSVGTGSALTVHLELDESASRLRIEAETELLRIAQEAITNARRHAQAKNLWVACRVKPPQALIRVEDDGSGLGHGRSDSFGLEIMRERAGRVGAGFEVRARRGGGTIVEVRLGDVSAEPAVRSEPLPQAARA